MLNAVFGDPSIRNQSKSKNLKDLSDLIQVISYDPGLNGQISNVFMDEFLTIAVIRAPRTS